MAEKKQRSVFWVVSTHVLTTGFAMPVFAEMVGYALILGMQPSPAIQLLMLFVCQALGYIGGAYYSLSYISKVALITNPIACVKPSIVTFIIISIIWFGLWIAINFLQPAQAISPVLPIIGLIAFYTFICMAFARITHKGFASMEAEGTSHE